MNIDLRQLKIDDESFSDVADIQFTDSLGVDTLVHWKIGVTWSQSGNAYHFHVDMSGDFSTSCHTCLQPVVEPVRGEFDVIVRRTGADEPEDDATGEEVEDYIKLSLTEHVFSLDRYIYENALVSIPMIIRCQEDCKGLCSQCGVNLNKERCSCEVQVDSPWQALRDIGSKDKNPQ